MTGAEPRDVRLKRMRMRAARRGTKEMDLILGPFAKDRLPDMDESGLELFDALLSENDQDLYRWVTRQAAAPAQFADLIADIARHVGLIADPVKL
ncbi:MAG TPA: succinate dehydrogenase assembly factor 2 [Aliiroseovarius sp.]|nr:succinate dehydrogenase assembly factor 2 [Aliiroseovarius sp.]